MKNRLLTLATFAITQLLFWLVASKDNFVLDSEVLTITLIIGVFLAFYWMGHRWAKWVAIVIMVLLVVLAVSMTFEGSGWGFLIVAALYIAVIFSLFTWSPENIASVQTEGAAPNEHAIPVTPGQFVAGEKVYQYPLLLRRYQALFIDGFIFLIAVIVTLVVVEETQASNILPFVVAFLLPLVYEPILTCYSSTIGQRLLGIRVRDMNNPDKRINILQAYTRSVVKGLLGWLSFITINFNPEHRAIHDFASSSVVIRVR